MTSIGNIPIPVTLDTTQLTQQIEALGTELDQTSDIIETRIVIGQRGWVWVGYWHRDGDQVTLTNAKNIRRWGTERGLGELVDGPLDETILDPAGTVHMHQLAVIASISVNAIAWEDHL